VTTNLLVFVTAALFEIAGCFAFWTWLRRGASPFVAVLGVASLVVFALALTRVDSVFAGRAYAAYGGIYIAASLMWLWLAEGQRPSLTEPYRCRDRYRRSAGDHRLRAEGTLGEGTDCARPSITQVVLRPCWNRRRQRRAQ